MVSKTSVANSSSQASNGESFQALTQGTVQNLTTTASSQAATALGVDTNMVRLAATKACYFLIKATSTAVTASNGTLMTDGAIDYFSCSPSDVITVIWVTEAGRFSITEGE